jgi:hypothetical protein
MSPVGPRVRGSNKRIDPDPSSFLGLLQACVISSLLYFIFFRDLLKYAQNGLYTALQGRYHYSLYVIDPR